MAARTAPGSCDIPECKRPRHRRAGIVHNFCGRTHAMEAVSRGRAAKLDRPHGRCHVCQLRDCSEPVYFDSDTGRVYDFCCRRHANKAMDRGEWVPSPHRGTSVCKLPGCKELVYRDSTTKADSEYCGKSHYLTGQARLCARRGCTSTAWLANTDSSQYCSAYCFSKERVVLNKHAGSVCKLRYCSVRTLRHLQTGEDLEYCSERHRLLSKPPSKAGKFCAHKPYVHGVYSVGSPRFNLCALDEAHPECPSLRNQFSTKWVKPQPAEGISVVRIFRVEVPAEVRDKHDKYARTVRNIRRRFHGTSCSDGCNFIVDPQRSPCGLRSCSLCNIGMRGFKLDENVGRTALARNFKLRYGKGVYFSSVSGKANDYADQTAKTAKDGTRLRCMFVANVAAGKAYSTKEKALDDDKCPPPGYESVVGEVGEGMNYDELVVYKEEAALPTHLIVYALH
ncbi:unnamed protein product [Ectocarpus sp. 12 AP-2014]